MCVGLCVEERPHRATPHLPSVAEPKTEMGHYTHRRTATEGSEGEGGRRGEGAGGKAYALGLLPRRIACGRSALARSEGEEISARARGARTRRTSDPIKRAEGSAATRSEPPPQVCPISVERGAGARRHAAAADSQAPTEGRREAGWPRGERSEPRVGRKFLCRFDLATGDSEWLAKFATVPNLLP